MFNFVFVFIYFLFFVFCFYLICCEDIRYLCNFSALHSANSHAFFFSQKCEMMTFQLNEENNMLQRILYSDSSGTKWWYNCWWRWWSCWALSMMMKMNVFNEFIVAVQSWCSLFWFFFWKKFVCEIEKLLLFLYFYQIDTCFFWSIRLFVCLLSYFFFLNSKQIRIAIETGLLQHKKTIIITLSILSKFTPAV